MLSPPDDPLTLTGASMAPEVAHSSRHSSALMGVALALCSAVGFSGKAILVKLAYREGVDAVTLLALRMVFSVPMFMAVALWSRGRNNGSPLVKTDWVMVIGLGLVGYYMSSLFDFMGLAYISAGLERLVLFLYPTMVVLISAALFRRPVGRHELVALTLSYAGIFLVFLHDMGQHQNGVVTGTVLVFISTLTYSLYLIGTGHVVRRIGPIRFTAYAMLVASMATLVQYGLTHPVGLIFQQTRKVYELGVAMAVFSTVLPVFMLSAGIQIIGAGRVSLVGSIGPVSTLFMAQFFLGEAITFIQLAGSSLVLAGVLSVSAKK